MHTEFPPNFTPIWQAVSEHIAAQVSKDTFQRWFKALAMTSADENDITLAVPNNIYQFWIESNYLGLLHGAVATVLGGPRTIHFITAVESNSATKSKPAPPAEQEDDAGDNDLQAASLTIRTPFTPPSRSLTRAIASPPRPSPNARSPA